MQVQLANHFTKGMNYVVLQSEVEKPKVLLRN
jgi:hypothetical protein